MAGKIRLGIIGASPTVGWAHRSHLPAIAASPEFELTGVCTTRMETAEESRRQYGAVMAFDDYHEILAHPDIDAVAVVLRVPAHYQITKDAINAGKHVFTEWPLGKTTGEAEELADLARASNVKAVVGLQARAAPAVLQMKQMVEQGYVGEIMSCAMTLIRGGVLARPSGRTWQRDVELGANTLTIATGHSIDASEIRGRRICRGIRCRLNAVRPVVRDRHGPVPGRDFSPDNILINGTAGQRRRGIGPRGKHTLGRKRIPAGGLRQGGHSHRVIRGLAAAGPGTAARGGRHGRAGGTGHPGPAPIRAGGHARGVPVQRGAALLHVRRGHSGARANASRTSTPPSSCTGWWTAIRAASEERVTVTVGA